MLSYIFPMLVDERTHVDFITFYKYKKKNTKRRVRFRMPLLCEGPLGAMCSFMRFPFSTLHPLSLHIFPLLQCDIGIAVFVGPFNGNESDPSLLPPLRLYLEDT